MTSTSSEICPKRSPTSLALTVPDISLFIKVALPVSQSLLSNFSGFCIDKRNFVESSDGNDTLQLTCWLLSPSRLVGLAPSTLLGARGTDGFDLFPRAVKHHQAGVGSGVRTLVDLCTGSS